MEPSRSISGVTTEEGHTLQAAGLEDEPKHFVVIIENMFLSKLKQRCLKIFQISALRPHVFQLPPNVTTFLALI